ncbi:MAG: DNA primase [Candidatus Margulisiibacteriota bacterium]|nr:MAG: DNA primase [Candidatus Margulisiibacteriota bacterium]HCY37906.1 DNA primase [Candidatus Margulisiibacteriota bacterium]
MLFERVCEYLISKETINEVIEKADIISVIRDYVSLRKRGTNYIGLCPFHNEKTPSFTVSPDKNIWHCFGCNEGGNVLRFITKVENFSFIEAIQYLANRVGVTIEIDASKSYDKKSPILETVNKSAKFYHSLILKEEAKNAYNYLLNRGFSDEHIKHFQIGYAPRSANSLLMFLKNSGAAIDSLISAGLVIKRENGDYIDRFRDRITFPICNSFGDVIAFGARIIPGADESKQAKYINSPENDIYHKGKILYGLHLTKDHIKKGKTALIVEGYMDFLSCYISGIVNVVATLGTAMTIEQARLIKRYADNAVIGYDSDAAGVNAALRAGEILYNLNVDVNIVEFSKKDPDEVIRSEGIESLTNQIVNAIPFTMFKIDKTVAKYNLQVAENVSKAVDEIVVFLDSINDALKTQPIIKQVSDKLKISEESVYSKLRQFRYFKKTGGKDSSKNVKQPTKDKYVKAQEIIIRIISQDCLKRKEVSQELPPEYFVDENMRKIYSIICNNEGSSTSIIEMLDDELLKNRYVSILINDMKEEVNGFWDNVKVLKNFEYEQKRINIEESIKHAQEDNNLEELDNLLKELNNLRLRRVSSTFKQDEESSRNNND